MTTSEDARWWSPFSPIKIDGYSVAQGDVYFFSVGLNPVDNASLLAVFPVVHFFKGCIGMSLSVDGVRWAKPQALVTCTVHGERASSHPAGWYLRGSIVHMFIQEDVPQISVDGLTPWPLAKKLRKWQPYSQLYRYSFQARSLREWTADRRRELKGV